MVSARFSVMGGVAAALLAVPAAAQTPKPAPKPNAPRPAASARPPAKAHHEAKEPLPEPELRFRLIAPSARGPWTIRLENEGTRWLRVPADLRLLELTVESGDTVTKRREKPVKCALPSAMRPSTFPDANALLLGPGDAYVESFDPRLFCFGKETNALVGGEIVRARYGWDSPKGAHKLAPPFAVEGTTFPPAVQPKKELVAPALVLSWLAPPSLESADPPADPPPADDKDKDDKTEEKKPDADQPAAAAPPVDELAPRLEMKAAPYADASAGRAVSLTVTITNVGHRPATAALRTRMLGFRVEGPDGITECPHDEHLSLPREAFQTIKPGGSVTLSMLAMEACGQELFRRPGLYRLTPTLHLTESGSEYGLAAITGTFRAPEPMLVRVATGPDPFYAKSPQAVRAPRAEGDEPQADK